MPFNMKLVKCNMCKRKYVPEILLTTIEPSPGMAISGKGVFLEARVCREKRKAQGEQNAAIVSELIPFVEYDLHRQLMYKLKVMGLNAAFGLKFQLAINGALIVAVASATAVSFMKCLYTVTEWSLQQVFVPALPSPPVLKINRTLDVIDQEDQDLIDIQKKIIELSKHNVTLLIACIRVLT
jgi:uncharacterized membrane protein YfbV (UPF0208 family)